MAELTLEEGARLVKAARQSIMEAYAQKETPAPKSAPVFSEPRGVFVTLHTHPKRELRGCIGFIRPDRPLGEAVVTAARLAAFDDDRFEPLKKSELEKIIIEISVLGVPQPLKAGEPAGRLKAVRIGTDGLVIQYGRASGLLLPQVAVEWNFTPQTFLEAVCEKAGLPKDMWKSASAKLWTFGAQIFAEEKPEGRVGRQSLVR
jgi:hypothetical protein